MSKLAQKVYLNGRFVDLEQACLPITDRGLLFGDSVYEVIPVYRGRMFRPEQHLARLNNSLAGIRMTNPMDNATWLEVLQQLANQSPDTDQHIYLQVTRGDYPVRKHPIPEQVNANVFAFTYLVPDRDPAVQSQGVSAITLDDIRWQRCNIKATTLLPNILTHAQAQDEGADAAIMVRDGKAMEGTSANLFMVSNGLIITPPQSEHLLPGITRDLVLELAGQAGLPYAEAAIGVMELENADEIWLTNSTREIMPVIKLNGHPVGDGRAGPMWQRANALYANCKEQLREHGDCNP